jgi:prophage tail gpP-like protein
MPQTDPALEVIFEGLGRSSKNVSSYSIDSSYLTPTDGFEVQLYEPDASLLVNLELEPVDLQISTADVRGASQLLGRIDVTESSDSVRTLTIRGRDYIGDLTECNVDPLVKVTKQMDLEQAIKHVAGPAGITGVVIDSGVVMRQIRAGRPMPNGAAPSLGDLKLEELKQQPGQSIFDFCNRMAARLGATLQPWSTRDTLWLSVPDYTQSPAYKLYRTADPVRAEFSNVKSSRVTRDYSKFPTYTMATGKGGGAGGESKSFAQQLDMANLAASYGTQLASTLDGKLKPGRVKPADGGPIPPGQLYRLRYLVDQEARTKEQVEKATLRVLSELLRPTLVYTAVLRGHDDPQSGALWAVDTIVDVTDEIHGIQEQLWCARRTFRYSQGTGAETELELWRRGTFQI